MNAERFIEDANKAGHSVMRGADDRPWVSTEGAYTPFTSVPCIVRQWEGYLEVTPVPSAKAPWEERKAAYGHALGYIVEPIMKMAQRGIKRADKPVFAALDRIIEKAADSQMERDLNEAYMFAMDMYDCKAANLETLRAVLRMDFKRMK